MDFSDENLNPLYCAIGKIVCAWSYIESFLDSCVFFIFHKLGGKDIAYKQEIPRSLDNKLKYLRKVFNNIDALSPIKENSLSLIDRISLLSKERHILIHGVLTDVNIEHYEFIKHDYGKEFHNIRELKINIDEILLLENNSLGLVTELAQILGFVFSIILKP